MITHTIKKFGLCLAIILTSCATGNADFSFIHTGANDPITEGWTQSNFNGNVVATPVFNDLGLGIDAWSIDDNSTVNGSAIQYSQVPSEAVNLDAATMGWSASITVRLLDSSNSPNPMFFDYRNEQLAFGLFFDLDDNLDLTVSILGETLTLEGLGNEQYVTYRLDFDPLSETADLFVNDVERLSDLVGSPSGISRLAWGASGSAPVGHAHFSDVSLTVFSAVPEPTSATVILLTALFVMPTRRRHS